MPPSQSQMIQIKSTQKVFIDSFFNLKNDDIFRISNVSVVYEFDEKM